MIQTKSQQIEEKKNRLKNKNLEGKRKQKTRNHK